MSNNKKTKNKKMWIRTSLWNIILQLRSLLLANKTKKIYGYCRSLFLTLLIRLLFIFVRKESFSLSFDFFVLMNQLSVVTTFISALNFLWTIVIDYKEHEDRHKVLICINNYLSKCEVFSSVEFILGFWILKMQFQKFPLLPSSSRSRKVMRTSVWSVSLYHVAWLMFWMFKIWKCVVNPPFENSLSKKRLRSVIVLIFSIRTSVCHQSLKVNCFWKSQKSYKTVTLMTMFKTSFNHGSG